MLTVKRIGDKSIVGILYKRLDEDNSIKTDFVPLIEFDFKNRTMRNCVFTDAPTVKFDSYKFQSIYEIITDLVSENKLKDIDLLVRRYIGTVIKDYSINDEMDKVMIYLYSNNYSNEYRKKMIYSIRKLLKLGVKKDFKISELRHYLIECCKYRLTTVGRFETAFRLYKRISGDEDEKEKD